MAEFLRFVVAVLIEFSLRHPGSLNEHSLTEGQSRERVTWILSCAFLRNWLTKLVYFTKHWLRSFGSCSQYSLSFSCNAMVLCMNTVWLKVNPVRELRESCPVRFSEIFLQSWQISKNNGWVPTFCGGITHWVFLATPWFFAWTQLDWRWIQWESYVNPVLCVCEKLAYKVGIFHKKMAEFLRFIGGGTHWVFLATHWFFAWTQLDWRSIQWESYVNPVLRVFVKLAYKVGKFQKTTAECLLFVVAVLIEFSLRHPGSLHEYSFPEGQSSERITWILSCAFLRNWLTKLAYFTKNLAEFLRFMGAVRIEFSLRHPGSLHESSLTEGQSSDWVTWILSCEFLRNWLTKLANFKKQWLSSYVSWWRYSLSFPCDTLVLCINPAWL